jgi:inhibitor of KinA sporulation pathway (predicted exonuclease)
MEYVIFDLEATCDDRKTVNEFKNEIIEIGAVKINNKGETIDKFSKFAKPYNNVKLTEFCKNLTTIKQSDIDTADNLDDVLIDFFEWSYGCKLISWGGYDMRQITRDVVSQNIESEIDINNMSDRHLDFKRWYGKYHKIRPCGMTHALSKEKIKLEGTHHRGIDDAVNITKIVIRYLDEL